LAPAKDDLVGDAILAKPKMPLRFVERRVDDRVLDDDTFRWHPSDLSLVHRLCQIRQTAPHTV
jgi:hypothetical protein